MNKAGLHDITTYTSESIKSDRNWADRSESDNHGS